MNYNEIFFQVKEMLVYIKENSDYMEHIDDKYSEFKNKYKSLFDLIKMKELDIELFYQMILIKIKVQNKEINEEEGNKQFASIMYKKCNLPELSNNDLRKISKQYKIPYEQLKEEYSNLKK